MDATPPVVVSASDFHSFVIKKSTGAVIPLIGVITFGVIQLFRYGNVNDYLPLSAAGVVSVLAVIGWLFLLSKYPKKERSWKNAGLAYAGFITYFMALYLTFYRGLWSLKENADGFSMFVVFKEFIFIFLGCKIISNFYQLTELATAVDENRMVIAEEKPYQ